MQKSRFEVRPDHVDCEKQQAIAKSKVPELAERSSDYFSISRQITCFVNKETASTS